MVSARITTVALALLSIVLIQSDGALALPKSSDSGIEYVKACDSGPDDVTNQCINRIPDDIGMSSGNHACAYHEAEVKCLGLCGNTLTWKVSYKNALKRYRLVCARYIEERIAEKEDDGEANGDSDSPPPSHKKADSDDSSDDSKGGAGDSSDSSSLKGKKPKSPSSDKSNDSKQDKKPQPKKAEQHTSSGSASKPRATEAKSSSSHADSSQAAKTLSENSKKFASDKNDNAENIDRSFGSDNGGGKGKHDTDSGKGKTGGNGDKDSLVKAMLPTMDPDIAGSSHSAHALTALTSLLVLFANIASSVL
ncbi:hypothetical protein GGI25_004113 [Coemansia spiralis]|uniref:Uncharacterized protein n=2 Tax=Coemansia TaxID=4863 RepID=A0A9W8KXG8_9FUNG|nr:hypothetical protein EDC05_003941 [Coemansia umbellata]KAJ2622397.1 hypothetical protein GGI26_003260 [Coemansia sp. RSA 1358]KAJ2675064.1 hypothetical protein GGI25_004113 [Coemansia spiralis]